MAAGLARNLGGERVEVRSAGSDPAEQVNPAAVAAMAEVDVDLQDAAPKLLEIDAVRGADVIVTMGCGDACPVFPGKRYEDWPVDDPAGQDIETVRRIVSDIDERVRALLASLPDA